MNQKLLTFLALGFGMLVILQAGLGVWLFIYNIGIDPSKVTLYYQDKSFHGLLEVLVPHTLFISIALMGFLHFLAFIETIDEKTKQIYLHTLFTLLIIDQSSGVLIALGWEWGAYLKLFASGLFQIYLAWVWLRIYKNSLQPIAG